MANSYRSLYFHIVFSTRNRAPALAETDHPRIFEYFGGIIRQQGGIVVAVGGWVDHIHLLFAPGTDFHLEAFVKEVKRATNKWLKEEQLVKPDFAWQTGYGAFTLSRWDIDKIAEYIRNQKAHHQKWSFEEEYRKLLKKHGVEFEEKYLLG